MQNLHVGKKEFNFPRMTEFMAWKDKRKKLPIFLMSKHNPVSERIM